jgi:hypothetical protein
MNDDEISLLEQNKDVQIIDGIEYPYVTVERNYPARIVCDSIKHDHFTTVVATLIYGLETTDLLTSDFKAFVGARAPYMKPYTKPKSIFEGVKPGTVVFVNSQTAIVWTPIIFQSETKDSVECAFASWEKAKYNFRLDNPYLED